MTKCTFHKYGPSGTITRHDGLCVLALNIINEKIYVFLWFWFLTVALFSAVAILYRMVLLLAPGLRASVIQARTLYQVLYCTVLYCTLPYIYCTVLYSVPGGRGHREGGSELPAAWLGGPGQSIELSTNLR